MRVFICSQFTVACSRRRCCTTKSNWAAQPAFQRRCFVRTNQRQPSPAAHAYCTASPFPWPSTLVWNMPRRFCSCVCSTTCLTRCDDDLVCCVCAAQQRRSRFQRVFDIGETYLHCQAPSEALQLFLRLVRAVARFCVVAFTRCAHSITRKHLATSRCWCLRWRSANARWARSSRRGCTLTAVCWRADLFFGV